MKRKNLNHKIIIAKSILDIIWITGHLLIEEQQLRFS